MQFKIKCSCGKSFRADETMIGRKFACPNCQQKLEVSAPQESSPAPRQENPPASEQVINVECLCGKKYRVSGKHIGKRLKCAACGETIMCTTTQPTPVALPKPADSMFAPIMNTEVEQVSPKPVARKTTAPQQKKKKSNAIAVLIAACTLGGVGMIVAAVFYSGILGPKVSPSKLPGAVAATEAAPEPPPPVPADDWAFVPEQIWTDRFAIVEPQAKLQADSRGLHVSLDVPQNSMKLVHRPCLVGDFKMQIEMQVQSMGQLNVPPTSPTVLGPQLVVGFIDAATGRSSAMRILLQPDQYSKQLSVTVERVGDHLTHNLGGPGAENTLPPTAEAGYVYFLLCAPAMITIEKIECVGTKRSMGFEMPNLQKLALDDNTWGPAQAPVGTSPQKLSLVFGENITVAPQQLGSFQFKLPVHGDIYLRGKVKLNKPIPPLPASRSPSVLQTEESPVSIFFESKRSGFSPHLLIPIGSNESTFTLVRTGKHIVVYCDGWYKSVTEDPTGDFDTFGFEVRASSHSVELSELQLYQSQ